MTAPTPIEELIEIDEKKLEEYPVWQRAARRKKMEEDVKRAIEEEKREVAELKRKIELAESLRQQLIKCGIYIPEDAEVDTTDKEPVIHFGGYHWSFNHYNENSPRITKDVPDALTYDDLEAISDEWHEYAIYRLSVSMWAEFNAESIISALDKLDKAAEYHHKSNVQALAAIKEAAAGANNASLNAEPETATITTTRTVQHYDVMLITDVETLQKYLDDGWAIAFEQFVVHDGETCHAVRFEREVPVDEIPTGSNETGAKAEVQPAPETEPDLSKFEAALNEIPDGDDKSLTEKLANGIQAFSELAALERNTLSTEEALLSFDTKLVSGNVRNAGETHRAIDIARKLLGQGLWDGLCAIYICGSVTAIHGMITLAEKTPNSILIDDTLYVYQDEADIPVDKPDTIYHAPSLLDGLTDGKPFAKSLLENGLEATIDALNYGVAKATNPNIQFTPLKLASEAS